MPKMWQERCPVSYKPLVVGRLKKHGDMNRYVTEDFKLDNTYENKIRSDKYTSPLFLSYKIKL